MRQFVLPHRYLFVNTTLWLVAVFAWAPQAGTSLQAASPPTPFRLDVLDDGKQLKLLVEHREIGRVCELWCYEGGPFHYGKGSKREDGSVVFVHTSGKMTATTTFLPEEADRVSMDILVEGPLEELKKVNIVGPCMQFWHSDFFKRENNLVDFAERCFLYTVRGPVGMMDTGRGPMKDFGRDAVENRPPWTQWYVPIQAVHPGDIWAFGASGDRPLCGLVGVSSRDGRWLSAMGCTTAWTLGQGWHDCIHLVPQMQAYLDEPSSRITHRSVIYVMANDKQKLLESYSRDFPSHEEDKAVQLSVGKASTLKITPPLQNNLSLDLSLKTFGTRKPEQESRSSNWRVSGWGGFACGSTPWRMWAVPHGEVVDLWVSLAKGFGLDRVEATLGGKGWGPFAAPDEVPAIVRRSADGSWIAALMWEHRDTHNLAIGLPTSGEDKNEVISLRGRVFLYRGDLESLRERWLKSIEEWEHARPYYMPLDKR